MFIFLILSILLTKNSYATSDFPEVHPHEDEAISILNSSLHHLGTQLQATPEKSVDYALFALYMLTENSDSRAKLQQIPHQHGPTLAKPSILSEINPTTLNLENINFVFYSTGLFQVDKNERFGHMINFVAPIFSVGSSFYNDESEFGFKAIFKDFLGTNVYQAMYKNLACNDNNNPYGDYFMLDEIPQKCLQKINLNDLSNFNSCEEKIISALQHTEEAELHFFWTTGRTPPKGFDPNPNPKVLVGGTPEYGQNFFRYVTALLDNSPEKIKVRFVCDEKTLTSNKEEIETLMEKHPNRFLVENIHKICERLKEIYPQSEETINQAFVNATWGNPAVASDVYRLIGMYFGFERNPNKKPPQLTYSDVDTFINGMAHDEYYELIEALFGESAQVPEQDSFSIFKRSDNNDIIKIRIGNIEDYKCDFAKVLEILRVPTKQTSFYNSRP